MINQHSLIPHPCSLSPLFCKPDYDRYCFSNIPGTVESLLTGDTLSRQLPADVIPSASPGELTKVVFIFVDGFGWHSFDRYRHDYPALKKMDQRGCWSKITSQFPSTTAAHVTTIHTGLPPSQSAVPEWYYYEPAVDAVISPLVYSFARDFKHGDRRRETLRDAGIAPSSLFPGATIYQRLAARGVRSHIHQYAAYTPSSYSDHVMRGASSIVPYQAFSQGVHSLRRQLQSTHEPAYFFIYVDAFDSTSHTYGPTSPEAADALLAILHTLEEHLFSTVSFSDAGNTLLLLGADHGQSTLDPERRIDLSAVMPELEEVLERTATGDIIAPCGSSRDLFLFVKPKYLEEITSRLTSHLRGVAAVVPTHDLHNNGYFGPEPSSFELRAKLGNLCVLPFSTHSVWMTLGGLYPETFLGHHGGLTPEEVETAFWSARVMV